MTDKKYHLVNYLEQSKIKPEDNPIPESEELTKLKENDFVFLIFEENGKEERMWVRITEISQDTDQYQGVLANEPVVMTHIKSGDVVIFGHEHIVNYSTKEEQERIIKEFNETGKLPTKDKQANFEKIKEIIKNILEIPETYEDGFKQLYKIKRIDRIFFNKNLADVTQEYAKSKERNKTIARMLTDDMVKMFLSLVLVVVIPQISENLDNGVIEYSQNAKEYYKKLEETLTDILDVYNKIAPDTSRMLGEIRRFYNDEELNRLGEDQLPRLFGLFIEETLTAITELS